jgi:hypothetical protein
MDEMPADVPTPDKRFRRLTVRRVLLAVVLGLVAWWGVGWWLSPRPLWVRAFPDLIPECWGFARDGRRIILECMAGPAQRVDYYSLDAATGDVIGKIEGSPRIIYQCLDPEGRIVGREDREDIFRLVRVDAERGRVELVVSKPSAEVLDYFASLDGSTWVVFLRADRRVDEEVWDAQRLALRSRWALPDAIPPPGLQHEPYNPVQFASSIQLSPSGR